ncbi:sporulation protein [Sphaerisporangium krabiense]|uniref:Sporulation-control protein n=1 Tax=Sphaerisporangium krabiense TaxID=763782 RepID=A0A7W9DQ44_9ACTN|nr:sporulation protein [Sphaerisporangium krabiense]MBB5627172.1 sporulation-control protein [Sphaerisporangium krabiense]GII65328.1 sporulation protein [Sphaerisporangium krabiense]
MVFKRLLGAFGVGAPSVDTVLADSRVRPGGLLRGEVRLNGGEFDAEIEHVTLGLVAGVEVEHGEAEQAGLGEFHRVSVSGPFTLHKGEDKAIPFEIPLSWELPVSEVGGHPLTGMALGVRTELAIAKAVDKGDLDPFTVEPLPSQVAILQAIIDLGFRFKSADLEAGRLFGVEQELPFYQEIEFYPSARHAGLVNEIELTFVASPEGLEVVLEADKSAGRFSGDAIGRFRIGHEEALRTDWAGELDRWLTGLAGHGEYGGQGQYGEAGPHEAYGHGGHPGGYGDQEHHRGGPGWGTVAAAGAAGVVGGIVAGEVVEEIFEDDEES